MSILDGMPSSRFNLTEMMGIIGPIIEEQLNELELTPRQRSIVELQKKGLSLADILDITQEQRDVLFVKGCTLIQAGKIQQGRDDMILLLRLEPLEARAIYALGVTYQVEGNISLAAKHFVQFLALDATNAEGYLRLGECLMAAGEYDEAADCFDIAKKECDRGNGNAVAAALVANRITELQGKRSDASIVPKSASAKSSQIRRKK